MSTVEPLSQLPARLAQHPAPQWMDEPGLFGQRDEGRGRDRTALGVVPPQQSLEADDILTVEREGGENPLEDIVAARDTIREILS